MVLRVLSGIFLSLCALIGRAENWQMQEFESEKHFLEIDQDSVERVEDGVYALIWRSGSTLTKPYFVTQALVLCGEESLMLSTSRYVNPNPVLRNSGGGADVVKDYKIGKRTVGTLTFDMSDSERMGRVRFPGVGAEHRMIRQMCQQQLPGVRPAEAAAIQEKMCGTKGWAGAWLCAKDSSTRETIQLLVLRLKQAGSACAVTNEQQNVVWKSWMAPPTECTGQEQNCGISLLQLRVAGLGDDLSRVAARQACTFLPAAIASAAEDEARRKSMARFRTCATRSIATLDDRISSADVIAGATYTTCKAELDPRMAQSKAFTDAMLPQLATIVLQQRKQTGKSPKSTLKSNNL